MITMQEWKAMGGKEQTLWLHENCQVNGFGGPRKPLFGVGVNDAPYCQQPRIDGKAAICPAYLAWAAMLDRAYSAKYHAEHPTYSWVKVCDEWHSFSNFMVWWLENQVDGWQLDKDLVGDGKLYSPDTCVFVPAWLNSFTLDSGSASGAYPIGVSFNKGAGRFHAQCGNPMSKKREHIGYFNTPEEAHMAWLNRKLEIALELKPKMDEIDLRIYPRVIEIINNAK